MPEFDFSDLMTDSPDEETILGMMTGMIEAYRYQQQTAIELTKLVVEKSNASMKEEEIFLAFKRASQVVSEISPIRELWEKMNE